MPNNNLRLAIVMIVCSIVLFASCAYLYLYTPQKTAYFQLSLTGSDGSILPPELSLISGQTSVFLVTVQNSMGSEQSCRLNVELIITNSSGTLLNSTSLPSYSFTMANNATWDKTFAYQANKSGASYSFVSDTDHISANGSDYGQNLLFQFKFTLQVFNKTTGAFESTRTWVSSPFLNISS
jgi:hypothetical protein